jgi:hypothetical protein
VKLEECVFSVTVPVHSLVYNENNEVKQAWTDPEGSRRLRLPYFKTAYEIGKVVSPTLRPTSPPGIFLLEAESTPLS